MFIRQSQASVQDMVAQIRPMEEETTQCRSEWWLKLFTSKFHNVQWVVQINFSISRMTLFSHSLLS